MDKVDKVDWLARLQVGDEVVVLDSWQTSFKIHKVTRTTPAQVMVGEQRFWRRDGLLVGMAKDGVWNRAAIRQVTEADRLYDERRRLRFDLERAVTDKNTTLPELRAMKQALDSIRLRMQTLRKEGAETDE